MERFAWKARLLPDMADEYKKRHDEIWPEMIEALNAAGIRNYSIWRADDDLFGYYECEQGVSHAAEIQAKSPVVDRWNAYMKDVMVMEIDPDTGAAPALCEIFYFTQGDDNRCPTK